MSKKPSQEAPPPSPFQNMYDVNPMMMEHLKEITPGTLPMFLFSNPQFVSTSDTVAFKKSVSSLSKYTLGSLIAGITINIQFKRIYPRIVSLPIYTRLPLRMALLSIPFALINGYLIKDLDKLNHMNHKYFIRIVKFRRTGNIEYMFPKEEVEETIKLSPPKK